LSFLRVYTLLHRNIVKFQFLAQFSATTSLLRDTVDIIYATNTSVNIKKI